MGQAQEVRIFHEIYLKLFDFVQYCWEQGGYLAEITSKEEEDLIDTLLIDGIHYWIGLTDIFVEGKNTQKLENY